MRAMLRAAAAGATLIAAASCVSYPVVKPEAFTPKPKVAIVSFQSEAVANATLGLPIKVEDIDRSYAAFEEALSSAGFEVVPTEQVRNCPAYFKLPKPVIDMGTTARGLARVWVSKQNAGGLARCVGADVVVAVYGTPKIVEGFQIAGIGTAKVRMDTEVHSFDNTGQEIWTDKLAIESDGFNVAGAVMDPKDVNDAGVQALTEASRQAVARFARKLDLRPAPAPAPAHAAPADGAAQ